MSACFHVSQLLSAIGKSRHNATSHQAVDPSPSPAQLYLSDSGEDPEKENMSSMSNTYRNKSDSSDDEFEQCEFNCASTIKLCETLCANINVLCNSLISSVFVGKARLKAKTATPRSCSSAKKDRYENGARW